MNFFSLGKWFLLRPNFVPFTHSYIPTLLIWSLVIIIIALSFFPRLFEFYTHISRKNEIILNTFSRFETIIFLICYTCLLYLFCIRNDLANRHHQEKTLKTFFVVFDSDKPYNLKGMNSSIDHLKQKNTIRKLQLTSGNKKSIQKCISVTKRIAIWQFLYPVQEKGKQKSFFFTWKPSKITAVVHPLK